MFNMDPDQTALLGFIVCRVHNVGFRDKTSHECTWIYAAGVISRHFLDINMSRIIYYAPKGTLGGI